MKFLILSTLIAASALAGTGYTSHNGIITPGIFDSPGGRRATPDKTLGSSTIGDTGAMSPQAGIPASTINTSPNPVPEAGTEVDGAISGDAVYETGPYKDNIFRQPFERQAQEARRQDDIKNKAKK